MSLFMTEEGSALEKLCLLHDGVGVSAWPGLGVGAAPFLRGGGEEGIASMYLGGRGLKESVCLLGGIGGKLAKLSGGGAIEVLRRLASIFFNLSKTASMVLSNFSSRMPYSWIVTSRYKGSAIQCTIVIHNYL